MEVEKETLLCKLAYKYGTDKCPKIKHSYTPYYYQIFKDLNVKKLIEVGIGYYEEIKYGQTTWDKQLNRKYHKGASLKMWRDFFLNAQIYGVDIKEETMFEDERIKTFVCDERKQGQIEELINNTGNDIDVFIDDGSHYSKNQINLAKMALPLLKKGVIYIIEDVEHVDKVMNALVEYSCFSPDLSKYGDKRNYVKDDNLVVIKT